MPPGILTLFILGLIVTIGGVAVLGIWGALGGAEMQERLVTYAMIPVADPGRERDRKSARLARLRFRLNMALSSLSSERVSLQLMRANWRITVTEFVAIRLSVTSAGLLLGWLLSGSPLPGIGLAVIAYLAPGIYLRWSIHRRQIEFEKQLLDVLMLLNGGVRAGFSLLQAMELLVREMKPPASEEFKRVVYEVGLGLTLPQALANLSARMENGDLELVVTAINIQHQVGGNMATMISSVAETIRERKRLFGEVRVLTTQQRYTGYLLSVLPFFVGALLFMLNPDYMRRLFDPGVTLCIPMGALAGIVLGHIVIQRIARIEL